MKIRDYDNADLAIGALLLVAVTAIALGYSEQGLIGMIVTGIAGIANKGSEKS
jgi:hypothetical protein